MHLIGTSFSSRNNVSCGFLLSRPKQQSFFFVSPVECFLVRGLEALKRTRVWVVVVERRSQCNATKWRGYKIYRIGEGNADQGIERREDQAWLAPGTNPCSALLF